MTRVRTHTRKRLHDIVRERFERVSCHSYYSLIIHSIFAPILANTSVNRNALHHESNSFNRVTRRVESVLRWTLKRGRVIWKCLRVNCARGCCIIFGCIAANLSLFPTLIFLIPIYLQLFSRLCDIPSFTCCYLLHTRYTYSIWYIAGVKGYEWKPDTENNSTNHGYFSVQKRTIRLDHVKLQIFIVLFLSRLE